MHGNYCMKILIKTKSKSISSQPPAPTQTWGRRWKGGYAENCLWATARWVLHSGCGHLTAAAGFWCRRTEAAGSELAGAPTALCCPLLESCTDKRGGVKSFQNIYIAYICWAQVIPFSNQAGKKLFWSTKYSWFHRKYMLFICIWF